LELFEVFKCVLKNYTICFASHINKHKIFHEESSVVYYCALIQVFNYKFISFEFCKYFNCALLDKKHTFNLGGLLQNHVPDFKLVLLQSKHEGVQIICRHAFLKIEDLVHQLKQELLLGVAVCKQKLLLVVEVHGILTCDLSPGRKYKSCQGVVVARYDSARAWTPINEGYFSEMIAFDQELDGQMLDSILVDLVDSAVSLGDEVHIQAYFSLSYDLFLGSCKASAKFRNDKPYKVVFCFQSVNLIDECVLKNVSSRRFFDNILTHNQLFELLVIQMLDF